MTAASTDPACPGPPEGSRDVLAATGMQVHFSGVKAVDGVDVELSPGEILGLIGPNGSGKTTCINAISGFVPLTAGRVMLDGGDLGSWTPQRRARAGLGRTFQGARLFRDLTVEENVEVSALGSGLSRRRARAEAKSILGKLGLDMLASRPAYALPAGDVRRVGIARAIATRPRYLLLDEPAAGLNESESFGLVGTIQSLRVEQECGVLLVDHDMRVIMGSCDRLQVLDAGRTIAEGPPDAVSHDEKVIAAYLGASEADARDS